ncbi:DUF397 domain-containing protein [Nonomuraea sp. NPDC005650]|uniref:DUF397 domain-containing protein n=1 Tax=Nonomuraea sp. NPDC005650 TaxID=3157045 RepID=UPI0033A9ED21
MSGDTAPDAFSSLQNSHEDLVGYLDEIVDVERTLAQTQARAQRSAAGLRQHETPIADTRHHDQTQPRPAPAERGGGVEVTLLADGHIAVRDSKKHDGPVLIFTLAEWNKFIQGVKMGEYDTPEDEYASGSRMIPPGASDQDRAPDIDAPTRSHSVS